MVVTPASMVNANKEEQPIQNISARAQGNPGNGERMKECGEKICRDKDQRINKKKKDFSSFFQNVERIHTKNSITNGKRRIISG